MDSYDYGYTSGMFGLSIGLVIFELVLFAGIYVLMSWFYMKLFQKAGVQGNWRAWVPVYSQMIFLKLGDVSPWLTLYYIGGIFLGAIIPFVGWFLILPLAGIGMTIMLALAAYRIGLKLGKEPAWVVLYIFVSIVWLGILAFDKSVWNKDIQPASWASNGFLGDKTVWEGIPVQTSAYAGYGAAPFGAAPYGQPGYPQAPQYGQPQAPQYGQPQAPQYGQPQAPQYGAPQQPQAPQYGAPQQAPQQPQAPQYGAPQAPQYGAPQADFGAQPPVDPNQPPAAPQQ